MLRRHFIFVILAALALAACDRRESSAPTPGATPKPAPTPGAGAGPAADTGPIIIGHYASLTGSEATFGQTTEQGIRLAVEEQNAAGGINGRPIKVITYDNQSKEQETGTIVTRLITQDKVIALLGEVASKRSMVGGRIAQEHGIPMISPSSTNPAVTQIGDMVFRVCFIDPFQGTVMAKFSRENLKVSKVAVLYDKSQTYSTGLAEFFQDAFKEGGGEITTVQTFKGGDPDFGPQLTAIRGSGAEAIYIPGYYNEVASIALQAQKLGIKVPLMGGDGWESPKLAEIAGDSIEGGYFSNHYAPEDTRTEVQEFIKRFKAKYNEVPGALSACGYDAAKLLFDSMSRSKSLDGKSLAATIAATKNFNGVCGNITLDKDRNAEKSAVVLQVKNGHPVFVATVEPGAK